MPISLLIIAQQGYQERELDGTRKGLMDAGFEVELASTEAGTCMGKFGGSEEAAVALRDVQVDDYDRIAFIGGPGAADFMKDEDALRIAREVALSGKPFGAICIAPTILAAAGVLQGKKATVWDDGKGTQIREIERSGAIFVNEPVVVDGVLVTGNGPAAAEEFGRVLGQITGEMPL
jgi:protease I